MKQRSILEQPSGTEGLSLRDAWNHKSLVTDLSTTFEQWGYLPVRTPVLDYYDAYSPLLSDGHAGGMYRLIDRDGDLLAVRSDATLFLAKQVARMLANEQLPLRVYYAESILRPEDREDISRNEFFQIGGELIGATGRHGDLEAATLLMRQLDSVLPGKSVLHLGNRQLIDSITYGFTDAAAADFREALSLHDDERLEVLLEVPGTVARSETERDGLLHFLFHIGSAEETRAALAELESRIGALPEAFSEAVRDTIETATVLESLFDHERIRIDFSESGSQSYHTGVAFRAYAPGAEAAVASGGRYDSLYGHFGLDTEAVGFSIMLRRLERLNDPGPLPEIHSVSPDAGTFVERLAEAEKLRKEGVAVRL